jgi:hypothetical protein
MCLQRTDVQHVCLVASPTHSLLFLYAQFCTMKNSYHNRFLKKLSDFLNNYLLVTRFKTIKLKFKYKLKPFSICAYSSIEANLKSFQSVFVSLPLAASLGLPAEKGGEKKSLKTERRPCYIELEEERGGERDKRDRERK